MRWDSQHLAPSRLWVLLRYGEGPHISSLALLPFALAFEAREVVWSVPLVLALLWLVFVLSFGAIWLFYCMIRRAAATRVVSLFYLTPPVTALLAWALFGEKLAPLALVGMAVCVAGVALVNWRVAPRPVR